MSPYVSHPPNTGGDHRTHGLVKEFPDAGARVTRYCQGGSPDAYRRLDFRRTVVVDDGYVERRHFNPIHDLAMCPVLFEYPNLLAGRALRFAPDGLPALLDEADVVLVRGPWQVPALIALTDDDTPVLYSSHNVEVERFEGLIPSPLRGYAESRLAEMEAAAVTRSDGVVCTGARDEDTYRHRFGGDVPIHVAPNGTYEADLRDHRPDSPAAHEVREWYGIEPETTVAVFVGSDYGPNVEAAEAVVEMADRTDADVHFLVVGTVGNALDATPDNVTTTGFVEEGFEAHFDAADLALNPMLSGGGTNIKLLDYFARSLPVVSTPFGARGISAVDGEHLVVADIDAFPDAIRRLMDDRPMRSQLGRAARELVRTTYTWEQISHDLAAWLTQRFDS